MRVLLKERRFLLFFGASSISLLGDWALILALPYYVYVRTGSILSTGGLVAAELLPRLLFSSVAGVLADRGNRRTTMVAVDLFRAGLVLLILFPAAGAGIWLVYVVAILEATAAQLFVAAEGAMLPTIVAREDELMAANSLLSTGTSLTRLVGPPLGGLLYVGLGLGASAIADSLSFVVAAAALLAVRPLAAPAAGADVVTGGGISGRRFLRELVDGVRVVASRRELEALCAVLGVVMVAQGMLETVLVPFVRDVLHFDALSYGVLTAAQGLGSLAGALGVGMVSRYLTSGTVVGCGLVLAGAFTFGFALARPLVLSAAFVFLLSLPVVVATIWVQTFYQQHVHNRLLGRVLGLTENVSALGVLAGVAAAATLGGLLGSATLVIAAAGVLFLAGLGAAVALRDATTAAVDPASRTTVEMPSG